jgi:hypothetical protein
VVGGLFDDDAHLCERFAEFVHRFGQRLDFVFAQGVVTGVVVAAVFRLVVLVEQLIPRAIFAGKTRHKCDVEKLQL